MFVLDTNVVSEMRRSRPHPAVVAWMAARASRELFVAAVSIGEVQRGIERVRPNDAAKAAGLEAWLEGLISTTNIIAMDENDFRQWARLMVGRDASVSEDAMIAATALNRGLTVVTRNTRDFAALRVPIVNPFA